MDFKDLFMSMGIVLLGIIALFTIATDFNTAYNTDIGNDMNATRTRVQTMLQSNMSSFSGTVGSNSEAQEGAGTGTGEENLVTRSLRIISQVPTLLGFPKAVLQDAGAAIGLPPSIVNIATWVFVVSLALTFGYLLLVGVGRLIT